MARPGLSIDFDLGSDLAVGTASEFRCLVAHRIVSPSHSRLRIRLLDAGHVPGNSKLLISSQ